MALALKGHMEETYRSVLKRVGLVLIVVGTLDVGYMVYCISNGLSYSSSFNLFAVIAGAYLLRGSLSAVRLVTWLSAFMFSGLASAYLVLLPFLKPAGLWSAAFRLNPIGLSLSAILGLVLVTLLFWVYKQLRSAPVVAARVAAGHSPSPPKLAFISGSMLVVFIAATMHFAMGGPSGSKAIELARAQHGDGYKYHVSAMRWSKGHTWASLSAYNDHEVKSIQVEWQE